MRHEVKFQIWYDGDWHDVPTRERSQITITRGRQDQLSRVTSTTLSGVEIDNRDGTYSPRNAMSPLWGKIGRNTRCRLLVDGNVEFVGEVESWSPRWDRSGHDRWVPVTAHGIMHRLGLPGQKALARSAMWRFHDSTICARVGRPAPTSYWALDAGTLATLGALTGGAGGPFQPISGTVKFGSGDIAPWLEKGVLVDTPAAFHGAPAASSPTPPRVVVDVVRRAENGGGGPSVITLSGSTTATPPYTIFIITFTPAPFNEVDVLMVATDGADFTGPTQIPAAFASDLTHIRFDAQAGGGSIAWTLYINGTAVLADTYTGTLRGLTDIELAYNPGSSRVPLVWSSVAYYDDGTAPDVDDAVAAMLGHSGEQAHERIQRIFTEAGISVTIIGSASARMGPQPIDTAYGAAKDAVAADMGFLWEDQTDFGFVYRCHSDLYNQAPALTLTWGQKEIGGPLLPKPDLDHVANHVTVRRRGGNETTLVQETGPLNVQDPTDDPQGVGPFEVSYELGVYRDDQTYWIAGWLRWMGTCPVARYPQVVIDCDALAAQGKTGLITAAAALRLGDRIQIASPPQWAQTSTIDLMVVGRTRRISGTRRVIELNCVPYAPWDVGALADDPPSEDDARLAGEPGAHLEASIGKDDTQIQIDNGGWQWAGVWLRDTGDRTESGTWGTPDVSPQWQVAVSDGGTPSVSGGHLILTSTSGPILAMRAGDLQLTDVQIYARGVAPEATPAGGVDRVELYARETGFPVSVSGYVALRVIWQTDGTAVAELVEGSDTGPQYLIPGVTASEPVDMLLVVQGARMSAWVAASSDGIDPWGPPTLSYQLTSILGPGHCGILVDPAGSMSTPLAMLIDSIVVSGPGVHVESLPYRIAVGGEVMAVTHAIDRSGDVQTLAVQRGVNGVHKAHAAGAPVRIADPLVLAL